MFFKSVLLIFVLPSILCEKDAGVTSKDKNKGFNSDKFLEQFGYMDEIPEHQGGHDPSDRERAVKEFQKMAGLPVNGNLDKRTLQKMKAPRCGVRDVLRPSERPGEFNTDPKKVKLNPLAYKHVWPNNRVSWKIMGYTRQLGGTSQRRSYINAFKKWTDVANLDAREVTRGEADIEIKYARRDHYDGSPFDGKGRTLAHAFFPGTSDIAGDTHFDDDEEWTLNTEEGTNLEIVAAHEFGHALGLGHSTNYKALMAPYYQGYDPDYKLHADDIYRIQDLYGRKTNNPRTTRRPTTTSKPPKKEICNLKFDSIFYNNRDRRIYFLRYRKMYRLESDQNGVEKSFTRVSRKILTPRVPINTGAAVMDANGRLYLFKGKKLFRYTNFRLDAGFPQKITIPFFQGVQAAVLYNNAIYVFKDDKYSLWHEYYKRSVPRGYPRLISSFWRGIPSNIEAAININDGFTYFFKGLKYFKFQNIDKRTKYRKDKAPAWLGCGAPLPK